MIVAFCTQIFDQVETSCIRRLLVTCLVYANCRDLRQLGYKYLYLADRIDHPPTYGNEPMKCPFCGVIDRDQVLDSRPVRDAMAIKRRRLCHGCEGRFTTFEEIEDLRLSVIKRDGTREPFDRDKLTRALETACNKRVVAMSAISDLIDHVERDLMARGDREVQSNLIGEAIMLALSKLDAVAFIRFASVYHQFEDADQFKAMVEQLKVAAS